MLAVKVCPCAGEAFVAKYDSSPGKQAGLGRHRDGTPWSFVMTLNQPDQEFMGGGTNFFQVNDRPGGNLFRPQEVGSVVLFSGRHLHEGRHLITRPHRTAQHSYCNRFSTVAIEYACCTGPIHCATRDTISSPHCYRI